MPSKSPIALFCSDLHLSEKPPIARRGEPDWIAAQDRVLRFINSTAVRHGNVPVFVAGDIFHKAISSPLVEWLALSSMKDWYCIPGQHDLPNHQLSNIYKSSYGILEGSQFIMSVMSPIHYVLGPIGVFGFPWGADTQCKNEDLQFYDTSIAMIHRLVWQKKEPYPGAPKTGNVQNVAKEFKDYDVIVAGDNHNGFVTEVDGKVIINCGSVMRRTADQEFYQPAVYILHDDLSVKTVPIPIEDDVFSAEHIEIKQDRDNRIASFVKRLKEDIEVELSFEQNMKQYLSANEIEERIINLIREAYGE